MVVPGGMPVVGGEPVVEEAFFPQDSQQSLLYPGMEQ